MPYLVKLHIFSGRPDPVWAISDKQAAELLEAEKERPEHFLEANSIELAAARPPRRGLGYRGFSLVESSGSHGKGLLSEMAMPAAAQRREAFIDANPAIERRLLESAQAFLDPSILAAVRESLTAHVVAGAVKGCPPCHGATAPTYDPGYWNNDPTRLAHNNCYNYANNNATNTFAQPGRASGHMYTALQCPNVRAAAVSDGLQVVANFTANIPGWYVALVIWPGQDYHWYRQDKNGCWSHKPGSTPVRNTDNSGHTISDPKTCDRGPYTVFCTYMTTKKGIKIN
jgi:hypothetical protein